MKDKNYKESKKKYIKKISCLWCALRPLFPRWGRNTHTHTQLRHIYT